MCIHASRDAGGSGSDEEGAARARAGVHVVADAPGARFQRVAALMRARDREDKAAAAALRKEARAEKKARRRAREEVRRHGGGAAAARGAGARVAALLLRCVLLMGAVPHRLACTAL